MHSKKKKSERSTWYPLFTHVQLPSFSSGNLETTVILVCVAQVYITESRKLLPVQDACAMPLVTSESQLMAIQHVLNKC